MSQGQDLPPGWTIATLGELGKYINGRGFGKSEWAKQGRPIIRIQDLTGTGSSPNYYEGKVEERYLVRPGDLLVSWAATLGAYFWMGPEGCLNQHIFRVESFIDKRFHYYLIQAILDELYRQTHGSGIVHITRGKFDSTEVALPPLNEQRRIVAAIEEQFTRLDAGVASLERVRANLRRYRASVLKAAVEGMLTEEWRAEHPDVEPASVLLDRILQERRRRWEEAELAKYEKAGKAPPKGWQSRYKEATAPDMRGLPGLPAGWVWATVEQLAAAERNSITDGPFGSNLKSEHYTESGARVIRLQNIGDGAFKDELAFISPEHFEGLRKHQVRGGDIVIAALGENPPRGCIIPDYVGNAIVKADCIRFQTSPNVLNAFVNYALNAKPTRNRVSTLLHGVGRPRLNLGEIKSIVLPLPPLLEQQGIGAEVERRLSVIEHAEVQVEAGLKRAARLRQSILKRAFEGKLVPHDPTDEPASALLERIRVEREPLPQSSRSGRVSRNTVSRNPVISERKAEARQMRLMDAE